MRGTFYVVCRARIANSKRVNDCVPFWCNDVCVCVRVKFRIHCQSIIILNDSFQSERAAVPAVPVTATTNFDINFDHFRSPHSYPQRPHLNDSELLCVVRLITNN